MVKFTVTARRVETHTLVLLVQGATNPLEAEDVALRYTRTPWNGMVTVESDSHDPNNADWYVERVDVLP